MRNYLVIVSFFNVTNSISISPLPFTSIFPRLSKVNSGVDAEPVEVSFINSYVAWLMFTLPTSPLAFHAAGGVYGISPNVILEFLDAYDAGYYRACVDTHAHFKGRPFILPLTPSRGG
jgi:hypothetical protein